MESWEPYFFFFFHVISSFLAVITAYLYHWLPNVQDAHGICVFHFSLNIAVMHLYMIFYNDLAGFPVLQEYCFIMVYFSIFIVFAMNMWSIILSYNTWNQVRQMGLINSTQPRKRLNWYRFLGYGVPAIYLALIIFLRGIYGYLTLRGTSEIECIVVFSSCMFIPALSSPFLNAFYFVDSQRRLWISFTKEADNKNENSRYNSFIAALNYKMRLNLKLSLTMNIPFAIVIILIVIAASTNNYSEFITVILLAAFRAELVLLPTVISNVTSSKIGLFRTLADVGCFHQGTFNFLACVAFRKRVIKSFIKYGDKSCLGCVRIPDFLKSSAANDDVEETDDESEERGAPLQSVENKSES